MNLKFASTLLALGALAAGSLALTVQFDGTGLGGNVRVSADGGATYKKVFAGVLKFTVLGSPVESFCADLTRTLTASSVYNVDVYSTNAPNLVDSNVVPGPGQVAVASGTAAGVQLAGRYAAALWSTAVTGTGANNTTAAALQLVIWRAVYGANFAVDGTVNAAAVSLANTYWSTPLTSTGAEYWRPNPLGNVQAQITFNPEGETGDPVPEPFTMGLVAAAVWASRKRRRKQA